VVRATAGRARVRKFKILRHPSPTIRLERKTSGKRSSWRWAPWGGLRRHRHQPLYAVKECFHGLHAIAITMPTSWRHVLIFWSLTMVVTIKYVTFILKADNEGEGGIYALVALSFGEGGQTGFRKDG